MITEKFFEDIICRYPELLEEGLTLKGRQIRVYGKIMDVLFEGRFKQKLIVELKIGPIDRKHIGQVMEYEGGVLSVEEPTARVMLVGNRVPPNLSKALDHHGIEWKELSLSSLNKFLKERGDRELLAYFEGEEGQTDRPALRKTKKQAVSFNVNNHPALFAPVEGRWIDSAISYFKNGKDRLYFYTNANIGQASELEIRHVYFKAKGDNSVSAQADFIELREDNPVQFRLPGDENNTGRYYYGYKNIRKLDSPINLESLKYYKSDKNLRNDIPGPCIIADPFAKSQGGGYREFRGQTHTVT